MWRTLPALSTRGGAHPRCEVLTLKSCNDLSQCTAGNVGDLSPDCGHSTVLPCYRVGRAPECLQHSLVTLQCGHQTLLQCGQPDSAVECSEACSALLQCGHPCSLPCHSDIPHHHQTRCSQPCSNISPACRTGLHTCPLQCWQQCQPCSVPVQRILQCGHSVTLQCHQDPASWDCSEKCCRLLQCGHRCPGLCSEPCSAAECRVWCEDLQLKCGHITSGRCGQPPACSAPCSVELQCGHSINVPCHLATTGSAVCDEKCGAGLQCGHSCPAPCSTCSTGLHAPCSEPCSRRLVCGHMCAAVCGEVCPPCRLQCSLACPHQQCRARCGEQCRLCKKCSKRRALQFGAAVSTAGQVTLQVEIHNIDLSH